jgi:hypothetical protein
MVAVTKIKTKKNRPKGEYLTLFKSMGLFMKFLLSFSILLITFATNAFATIYVNPTVTNADYIVASEFNAINFCLSKGYDGFQAYRSKELSWTKGKGRTRIISININDKGESLENVGCDLKRDVCYLYKNSQYSFLNGTWGSLPEVISSIVCVAND